MTVVDFDNLNPGAKFPFEEDKKGKTLSWVKVRAYTNEALELIRKECVKQEVEYKRVSKHGPFQRIEYTATDDNKMKRMLWDYVITDWGGFVDKSSKEIPCTAENKAKFMLSWPAFQSVIDKCLEKLTPDVKEAIEEAEKN
jgi:hypothetical protein